jgi:hypothetical protein
MKHQVFVLVGNDASSGLRTLAPGASRESTSSTFIKKETPSLYGGGVDVQQEGSLSSLLSSSSSSASSTNLNLLESSSSSGNYPTEGQTLDFRNLMWPHKDKRTAISPFALKYSTSEAYLIVIFNINYSFVNKIPIVHIAQIPQPDHSNL